MQGSTLVIQKISICPPEFVIFNAILMKIPIHKKTLLNTFLSLFVKNKTRNGMFMAKSVAIFSNLLKLFKEVLDDNKPNKT